MDVDEAWQRSRNSGGSIYVQLNIVVVYAFDYFCGFIDLDVRVAFSIKW
jgi:hypothetical protein